MAFFWATAGSAQPSGDSPSYRIEPTTADVRVDGILDEEPWGLPPTFELAYESYPADNAPATFRTEVWLTFNEKYLFVAFRAYDPAPQEIRARYSERDLESADDDSVGIALDPFNDGRRAFKFYSTAIGIQADFIVDEVARANDYSWDAHWSSAGVVTSQGYDVEMAIPLSTLRYRAAPGEQTWGIDAIRLRPRKDFKRFSLVPLPRGETCLSFCRPAKLVGIVGKGAGLSLELDPTLTSLRTDRRGPETGGRWDPGSSSLEAGITSSWRPRPNLTLNAAVNPDFSQVEADAIQLDANRQFALFYPERRPFFLEGADFFATPIALVYSRNIADPAWGAKATGRQGRNTFGLLLAEDEVTNLLTPGPEGSELETLASRSRAGAVRYRWDAGKRSTIGGTYTYRSADGYENDVAAVDTIVRWSEFDSLSIQGVATRTSGERSGARSEDWATGLLLSYTRETRDWEIGGSVMDLDEAFRADLGFEPQVDLQRIALSLERRWYPDSEKIYSVSVGGGAHSDETRSGEPLLHSLEASATLIGDSDTVLSLTAVAGERFSRGLRYDIDGASLHAERRFGPAWFATLDGKLAGEIDYEGQRQGELRSLAPGATASLGAHFSGHIGIIYEALQIDEGELYAALAGDLRLRWQFDRHAFVRATLQQIDLERNADLYLGTVDSRETTISTQWLFGYEWSPETVFYLGYSDHSVDTGRIDLGTAERTFFAKVGYALVW